MSLKGSIRNIARILGTIGAYFLLLLVVLVTVDVCGRYFFNSPVPGTLEVSEVSIGVAILIGLFCTTVARGHITVDVVVNRFSPRTQGIINTINTLLGIALWGLIVWQGVIRGVVSWQTGETLLPFGYPRVVLFPFKFLLPVAAFLCCLELIIELGEGLTQARVKKRL